MADHHDIQAANCARSAGEVVDAATAKDSRQKEAAEAGVDGVGKLADAWLCTMSCSASLLWY